MRTHTIALLISFSLVFTFISGCTSTSNTANLSSAEKDLLKIQEEISTKIGDFSEDLQKSDMDYDSISQKADQVDEFINKKIKETKNLGKKLENNKFLDKTNELLKSAKRITSKLDEVAGKLNELQTQSSATAKQQFDELKKSFNGYKTRLSYYKEKFTNLSNQLLNPPSEESAKEDSNTAEPTQSSKASEATI